MCAVGAPEPNGLPQGVREAQKASITVIVCKIFYLTTRCWYAL